MGKDERKYWVEYLYPMKKEDIFQAREESKDIDPSKFDAEIPKGAMGYSVNYGKIPRIDNLYSVYKGEILSFAEAKEKFPNDPVVQITEEEANAGKTTEELKKNFVENPDLQECFKRFVQECEQMSDLADDDSIGIVVMNERLFYLHSKDIVLLIS